MPDILRKPKPVPKKIEAPKTHTKLAATTVDVIKRTNEVKQVEPPKEKAD